MIELPMNPYWDNAIKVFQREQSHLYEKKGLVDMENYNQAFRDYIKSFGADFYDDGYGGVRITQKFTFKDDQQALIFMLKFGG
jgi:hypothetical protein